MLRVCGIGFENKDPLKRESGNISLCLKYGYKRIGYGYISLILICFNIFLWIWIRIRILSAISNKVQMDIDIVNIWFEYSDAYTKSDVKYPN